MPVKHEPTAQTRGAVKSLAAFGMPQENIATNLRIDAKTLRKHYREELDTGAAEADAMVGQFIYKMASGKALKEGASWADCSRQAMFWAKTRMGWRETDRLEVTGKDGENIKVDAEVNAIDKLIGAISRFAPAADAEGDTEGT